MVIRQEKKNRKYHGTRRWGVGNIKNARGAGDRGGSGSINRLRKHDFTYITAKRPDLLRKKGFVSWNPSTIIQINLNQISKMAAESKDKKELELKNHKVLSNGKLSAPITIKATKFSKKAMEKIKSAGGQAIVLEK